MGKLDIVSENVCHHHILCRERASEDSRKDLLGAPININIVSKSLSAEMPGSNLQRL